MNDQTMFYKIEYNTAFFPQIQGVKSSYNKIGNYSLYNGIKDSFPERIDLDGLILDDKCELTDFLSTSIWPSHKGFFCNKKVVDLLSEFSLPPYRKYNAKLLYNSDELDSYYWIEIIIDILKLVDYEESYFYKTDSFLRKKRDIKLASREEFLIMNEKLYLNSSGFIRINSQKAKLLKVSNSYDLLPLNPIQSNFIISERLRSTFIDSFITGIEYSVQPINVV